MILHQCSINGKKYRVQNFGVREENSPSVMRLPQYDPYMRNFFQTLSLCHTVQVGRLDTIPDNGEVESSFEIIESADSSLGDIEEDIKRKEETAQNTKQNEIRLPDGLLNEVPSVQRKYTTVAAEKDRNLNTSFTFFSSQRASSGKCI